MEKISNLSKGSKENIVYSNRIFDEFCHKSLQITVDHLILEAKKDEYPDEVVLEVLQDWVNEMSGKVSYSAIRVYSSGINRYLKYHKIRLDMKDVEWPQKIEEERYAISLDEITKLLEIAAYERRALYLALISTGARPIEIIGLRKKDIQMFGDRYKAIIPAFLTKKKMARTIVFSREIAPYMNTLLTRCATDDDTPFGSNEDPEVSRENEDKVFRYYCDKLAVEDSRFGARYESTGYHKIILYCFRGYFFTKVMRLVGDDTAHALIGHGAYMQKYQQRTDEEKMELWAELEPEILVHENKKKEAKQEMENTLRDRKMEEMEERQKESEIRQKETETHLKLALEKLAEQGLMNIEKKSD